uniref:Uncharacterized protein n=1 Tax=Pavo cristatus TaxID=9049 RepID=A0A8C9FYI5_PAVCR
MSSSSSLCLWCSHLSLHFPFPNKPATPTALLFAVFLILLHFQNCHLSGRDKSFCVKLVCIHPIRYNGRISKGQVLGRMLPMQRVFPGITSHIHVENCDHSDPTSNLERGKGRSEMEV